MTQTQASDTPSPEPASVFTDLVTGETIDDWLDPQAFEVAAGAVASGGLPADIAAERAAFDELFAGASGLSAVALFARMGNHTRWVLAQGPAGRSAGAITSPAGPLGDTRVQGVGHARPVCG